RLGEIDPGHPGHQLIGDQAVDVRLALQDVQGFFGGSRLDPFVTELDQHVRGVHAHQRFVIDQNTMATGTVAGTGQAACSKENRQGPAGRPCLPGVTRGAGSWTKPKSTTLAVPTASIRGALSKTCASCCGWVEVPPRRSLQTTLKNRRLTRSPAHDGTRPGR